MDGCSLHPVVLPKRRCERATAALVVTAALAAIEIPVCTLPRLRLHPQIERYAHLRPLCGATDRAWSLHIARTSTAVYRRPISRDMQFLPIVRYGCSLATSGLISLEIPAGAATEGDTRNTHC